MAKTKSQKLKRLLPWVFCVLIFLYLFSKIHPGDILQALKLANIPLLLLFSFLYFCIVYYLDCLALRHFLSRFSVPLSLKETLLVRGVTYLLMIVNLNAGQGAIAVYLRKTRRAPLAQTLGAIVFIMSMDLLLIITSALISLVFAHTSSSHTPLGGPTLWAIFLVYPAYLAWVILWRNADRSCVIRLRKHRWVDWIFSHGAFHAFRAAGAKDYVMLILYRLPLLLIILSSCNLAALSYKAFIPWRSVYLYYPLVMLLTSLPITPAGLGTGQILMITFFADVIKSPLIEAGTISADNLLLTSSLTWFLANQTYKALIGIFCLKKTSPSLFQSTSSNIGQTRH